MDEVGVSVVVISSLSWGTIPGCAPLRRCTIRHAPEPTLIFAPSGGTGNPRYTGLQHTGATWFRRGRFSGRAASRGPGGLVKPREQHKCEQEHRTRSRCLI